MGQIHLPLLYDVASVLARPDDVVARMLALDGTWVTAGVDTAIGIVPESVQLHADRRGPSTASFDLRRRADTIWPDLAAWAPVVVEVGGVPRWRGLTGETPIRDAGAETVISVQCRGRQFDLDADVFRRDYVHTRLADWRDVRTWTETVLGANAACAAGQVSSESGSLRLAYPNSTAMTVGSWVGVALDLGDLVARRVVIEWESSNNTAACSVTCRGGESPDQSIAWGSGTRDDAFRFALNTGAAGTSSGTFANGPHRFVQLYIFNDAYTATAAADIWLKIKAIRVFTDPDFEAGGQSILKASTVLNDALDRTVHGLSPDRSRIAPSSFNIPDFAPRRFVTIGEAGSAVNAWHNQILKVDLHDRLVFQPRPTVPEIEIGAWPGSTFTDSAANSGEEIFNRAIVEGQNHDGTPVVVDRNTGDLLLQLQPTREVGASNPSMDVDASGWRPIWFGRVSRDTGTYRTSPASLAVTATGAEGTVNGTFRRGVTYVVDLWVLTTSSLTASGGFSVQLGTSTDWSRGRTGPIAINTWTRVRVPWRPLADSAATLAVYTTGPGDVTTYIDDVAFFTSMPTLADRRGRREPKIIQPSFPLSPEAAQQLTDTLLRGHATTPLRGEAVIGIGGARHVLGGHDEHPAGLLDRTGELLGLAHRIDPDTGAVGRRGEIASVSYIHRDLASTVSIDDNRGNFDALVARLESIQGAG